MKHFLLFALSLWMMMAALLLGAAARVPREEQTVIASHFHDGKVRLVVVSVDPSDRLPLENEDNHVLSALLLAGELPTGRSHATVLTDLNCQADEQGISHCTNDVQIGDMQIALQHDHDMRKIPCLTPGEVIELVSLAEYRATVTAEHTGETL
jgi:hypothetical protein